jgi:hypothetical protein
MYSTVQEFGDAFFLSNPSSLLPQTSTYRSVTGFSMHDYSLHKMRCIMPL